MVVHLLSKVAINGPNMARREGRVCGKPCIYWRSLYYPSMHIYSIKTPVTKAGTCKRDNDNTVRQMIDRKNGNDQWTKMDQIIRK